MDEHKSEVPGGLRHAADAVTGLGAVQKAQIAYDRDLWDIRDDPHANVRHVHIHLSIAVGKLARLLEARDHAVHHGEAPAPLAQSELAPIVADLVIHAAQLANIGQVQLGESFAARYRENAARFAPESALVEFGAA
jgi:hypothetical protein